MEVAKRRRRTNPRRFEFSKFIECKPLRQELSHIATERILIDLVKSLMIIRKKKFIKARDSVDITHGLFGLSLDDFYARLKENTVYISVLQLVSAQTLNRAMFCIVVDQLQAFIRRLGEEYVSGNMKSILSDISKSESLLTISDTIKENYNENKETLRKLCHKLNAFNIREKTALAEMDNRICEIQNQFIETDLVLGQIEYRYTMGYHHRTVEQSEQELRSMKKELHKAKDNIRQKHTRENTASLYFRMKETHDIDMLKNKLNKLLHLYESENDRLDQQISYKSTVMTVLQEQYRDCLDKKIVFANETVLLKEWMELQEVKKRQEVQKFLTEKTEKRKKRRNKKKNSNKHKI